MAISSKHSQNIDTHKLKCSGCNADFEVLKIDLEKVQFQCQGDCNSKLDICGNGRNDKEKLAFGCDVCDEELKICKKCQNQKLKKLVKLGVNPSDLNPWFCSMCLKIALSVLLLRFFRKFYLA